MTAPKRKRNPPYPGKMKPDLRSTRDQSCKCLRFYTGGYLTYAFDDNFGWRHTRRRCWPLRKKAAP